jgi:lysophospholipase L1-like esterase
MTHYPARKIRFKEHQRGQKWTVTPTETQRQCSDETLGSGPFSIEVDDHGFISSSFESSPERSDIIILGDSIPENTFVDADARLSRVIERSLNDHGHKVRVLNGGVSGATTLHSLNVLATKVIALRPKLVVVMNGTIDMECAIETDSFWTKHEYYDPFTYDYVDTDRPYVTSHRPSDFEDRKRLLRSMIYLSRQFSVPIALATSHYRGWEGDALVPKLRTRSEHEERSARWDGAHDATRLVSSEMGVALIDVNAKFRGRRGLLYDDIHMNAEGSREIGQWMARCISDILKKRNNPVRRKPFSFIRRVLLW